MRDSSFAVVTLEMSLLSAFIQDVTNSVCRFTALPRAVAVDRNTGYACNHTFSWFSSFLQALHNLVHLTVTKSLFYHLFGLPLLTLYSAGLQLHVVFRYLIILYLIRSKFFSCIRYPHLTYGAIFFHGTVFEKKKLLTAKCVF